jgi:hypothetical protein
MQLELSVEGLAGLGANLFAFDVELQAKIITETHESGEFCKELTQFFCPVETGWMQEHVQSLYPGLGMTFETGWSYLDFIERGSGRFYPYDQEFGNSVTSPQPSLTPAYAVVAPMYKKNVGNLIRESIAKLQRQVNRSF